MDHSCLTVYTFFFFALRYMKLICLAGVPRRLQIIQGPDNITVAIGTKVSLQCTVRGFPVPMVHWFKDGCLLLNRSGSFSVHNNGQLLTLRSDTVGDLSYG